MTAEWLHTLSLKLKALVNRKQLEQDLDEELAFHLAMKANKARAEGAPEPDAAAHRRFGNAALRRESLREAWTFPTIESFWHDTRQAARVLRKSPVFTAVAVLSLGIGIGANASIFTVFNALFLQSLPVSNPQNLRIINWTGKSEGLVRTTSGYGSQIGGVRTHSSFSMEAFREIAKGADGLASVGGFAKFQANVLVGAQAHSAPGQVVTGRYFETLGASAQLGRTLLPSDDTLSAPPVAVISWRLYQRLYAAQASALGAEIRIDKSPYTVVGVLPPGVFGLFQTTPVDLYVPMAKAAELTTYPVETPNAWWMQLIGRMEPGATDAQVQASLDLTLHRIASAHASNGSKRAELKALVIDGRTGLAFLQKRTRDFLLTLGVMVVLVLLIACANLANLLTARGTSRERELAIRRSLGAGRLRITRYILTESILIALLGGALGLLLAFAGTSLLTYMVFTDPDAPVTAYPDGVVLAFTLVVSLLTALLFGTIPALRAAKVQPASCLKLSGAGGGRARQKFARVLIVAQVALALVLVVGAGLFARTLGNLGRVELGFRSDHLLSFYVEPKRNGYTEDQLAGVYRRIQDQLTAIPGVQAVTQVRNPLLIGWMSNDDVYIRGRNQDSGKGISSYIHVVGERFLTTLGTPMLAGRDFEASDHARAPRVAIINATMARKYFEGNPIGQEIAMGDKNGDYYRIIGIAADSKYDQIRREIPPTTYFPWTQRLDWASGLHFQVRTAVDPLSLVPAVRAAVAAVDATLPVSSIRSQDQLVRNSTTGERNFAILGIFFGTVAVTLACIGIYGVLAYSVSRRTSEFGIRLALGATGGQVRWLVLRSILVLIVVSIAIGIPSALAATKLIKSTLYGVQPNDAVTLAIAIVAVILSALFAAWIPAHRAAKSDPSVALRYE